MEERSRRWDAPALGGLAVWALVGIGVFGIVVSLAQLNGGADAVSGLYLVASALAFGLLALALLKR